MIMQCVTINLGDDIEWMLDDPDEGEATLVDVALADLEEPEGVGLDAICWVRSSTKVPASRCW